MRGMLEEEQEEDEEEDDFLPGIDCLGATECSERPTERNWGPNK